MYVGGGTTNNWVDGAVEFVAGEVHGGEFAGAGEEWVSAGEGIVRNVEDFDRRKA